MCVCVCERESVRASSLSPAPSSSSSAAAGNSVLLCVCVCVCVIVRVYPKSREKAFCFMTEDLCNTHKHTRASHQLTKTLSNTASICRFPHKPRSKTQTTVLPSPPGRLSVISRSFVSYFTRLFALAPLSRSAVSLICEFASADSTHSSR